MMTRFVFQLLAVVAIGVIATGCSGGGGAKVETPSKISEPLKKGDVKEQ